MASAQSQDNTFTSSFTATVKRYDDLNAGKRAAYENSKNAEVSKDSTSSKYQTLDKS
jgi:hypothetical protein